MDLLISFSYTESFSMVTADGVAEGLASVASDAIDWAPGGIGRRKWTIRSILPARVLSAQRWNRPRRRIREWERSHEHTGKLLESAEARTARNLYQC